MRILVTGGCGFLGSHIVEHLLKNTDAELVVLDKLTYASRGFDRLRDIQCFDDKRVRVLGADLARPVPVGIAREIGEVETIIHTAAETHVDRSIEDPLPFLESNVLGTHYLLTYAKEFEFLEQIFLVSTDEVYGPAPTQFEGYAPDARFRPTNPYAASKVGAEALGMAYANTYGLPVVIVNGMNLIGERQHVEKMVPKSIRAALTGAKLPIHSSRQGKPGTRFYLHCRNFADALLFMLGRHGVPSKVHVVGDEEVSNLDLAARISARVGRPIDTEMVDFHSSRPGHDLRYAMVDTYLAQAGWRRPVNFAASLERTVDWYLRSENRRWLEMTT